MKITEQLAEVQAKLKAPKGQYNQFGKYNYRSCEDILESVKPLLKDQNLVLILDDSVESVGSRIYIKTTAKLQNADGESLENHAFARESETKKGMDDSQITGTASSYARKYALNGLFLIDDTKDADTDEYQQTTAEPINQKKYAQKPQYIDEIKKTVLMKESHRTGQTIPQMLAFIGKMFPDDAPNTIGHVTEKQFTYIVKVFEKMPDKAEPHETAV